MAEHVARFDQRLLFAGPLVRVRGDALTDRLDSVVAGGDSLCGVGVCCFSQALLHFERVLAAYPDNLQALKAVGSLYLATGKKEKALTTLRVRSCVANDRRQSGPLTFATERAAAANAMRWIRGPSPKWQMPA